EDRGADPIAVAHAVPPRPLDGVHREEPEEEQVHDRVLAQELLQGGLVFLGQPRDHPSTTSRGGAAYQPVNAGRGPRRRRGTRGTRPPARRPPRGTSA